MDLVTFSVNILCLMIALIPIVFVIIILYWMFPKLGNMLKGWMKVI